MNGVLNDIELREVRKRFGETLAVDGVSFDVKRGEFLTLLGPSGCGKTTTLNMVAGFVRPDEGVVRIQDRNVTELPPYERDTGMVFQSYALFPHMTVGENVIFGLQMRKTPREEAAKRVADMLERVQLSGYENRYPRQLSGGQQQRVALARALVTKPAVLLLDEPLSNLDLKLREAMRFELKSLQRDLGITSVYVTHDQDEALVMSDRIAIMHDGRIDQIGTPEEIYESPATIFGATFIGATNLLEGTATSVDTTSAEVTLAATGRTIRTRLTQEMPAGTPVVVSLRPEKCAIGADRMHDAKNHLEAEVRDVIVLGSDIQYQLLLPGNREFTVRAINADTSPRPIIGETVEVSVPVHHCLAFPVSRAAAEGEAV